MDKRRQLFLLFSEHPIIRLQARSKDNRYGYLTYIPQGFRRTEFTGDDLAPMVRC